jgi:hypothetical protein
VAPGKSARAAPLPIMAEIRYARGIVATINAAWHAAHVLGRGANLDQRIAWHRAHQRHCACRPVPTSLAEHFAAPASSAEPGRVTPRAAKKARARTRRA